MAASKAAPSTTPSLVNVTSSTTTTNLNINNNDSLVFTKPDICHNFHELCRSCGKTNDQLYDLFQTPNSSSSSSSSSPFNTSSTTCYTHLNNSCSKSSSLTTSALATANKTLTTVAAVGNCAKTANALTLDTVAATAKASAKGQSNMDNILQEMQIWQLMIKCNDGLPQRICAKCTAQFYMIHKFRRKCLKVQTQLRALNEEQKIYERRQQLENEKNGNEIETETETEAKVNAVVVVVKQSEPTLQAEAVKPCEDLVNDKTTSEQAQAALVETKSSSSTSSEPSVSFETIVGNTNNAEKVEENDATLLDNVVAKTMPENSTMSAALAVNDKTFETHDAHAHAENLEEVTLKRLKLKDEKKPLLKAAVLNSKRSLTPPPQSSSLTLKQSLEQICDNELTAEENNLENANKKLCLDQEDLLATHDIYKTNLSQKMEIEQEKEQEKEDEQQRGKQETCLSKEPKEAFKNSSTENLFITKAALKSYTIPPTTIATTSATTTESLPKIVTNSEAKSNNDNNNNNNNAHLCDKPNEVNDNTCTSTSSPTTPSSSPSSSSSTACSHRKSSSKSSTTKPFRTKVLRHKIVKYVTISNSGRSQKRSGYFTKTKKALANQSEIVVVKRKEISWRNKHKLKRLNAMRTCKSPTMSPKEEHKQEHDKIQQIENETSSTVSTITSTTSFSSPSSSSSSSSSATMSSDASTTTTTTPDVSNLVEEQDNIQTSSSSSSSSSSYNNENTNETVSPSMEGISSNKSSVCLMWKTKAAMKANANDMPEDVVVHAQQQQEQQNIAESSATTTPLTGSACLAKETRTSSKTLNENQSIISSSSNNNNNYYYHHSNNNNNNNNNNLMEEHSLTNKVLTSTDNQVKDIEDESKPNLYNNLWPEEVDQKQIKANIDNEIANINDNYSPNSSNSEKIEMEMKIEEKSPEPAENLTPPNKQKGGCMKLIIQRKRGARFKCRRKEEDDDNETPQMSENNNLEPTTPKRRRKNSANSNLKLKLDMATEYSLKREENKEEDKDIRVEDNSDNERRKVPAFNSDEDENKENPIDQTNHPDFDSDSNVSVYRDPLLIRNEILEEETPLMDFPKPQLSLQTECSKEMYKLYKEKANLESPKKLIVRVPLTSLTQDFKRMHLTMEQETEEEEAETETETNQEHEQKQETEEQLREQESEEIQAVSVTNSSENEEQNHHNNSLTTNISSSQSDLLGFSQTTAEASSSSLGTADSSQPSVEMVRYVLPPLCSASSKINDFINDFQNNCIDSSEIDETCDMVPHLGPRINQELSDEIRDVEDTLNGILSEMHDKDMYTPRSGETDEFFAHSVYSPLTDSPTTPSQSFYAESPCTINSNPMSVSPFVHQNMDYNAMTPQSNHSSMGHSSHIGSVCSGGSSSSHAGVYSEHYPAYNECFEETTQSELIGFQNDIPCFENIDINNHANNNNEFAANTGELNEEEEVQQMAMEANCNNLQNNDNENGQPKTAEEIVDYIDLSDYKEGSEDNQLNSQQQVSNTEVLPQPQQVTYQAANSYQPSLQMPSTTNNLTTQPHYIVTNTNQGPIIIANPHLNQAAEQMEASFKPHSNNLQFVTLGQAMEASQHTPNHLAEISWPATNNYNPQPVLTANNNGTTTYFINANGELYQASIPTTTLPNPSLNTILMPTATNANPTFNQTNMDNNENYVQQTQPPPAPQPQPQPQQNGQYIMLVNNLGGTPQYYATTQAANLNQSPAPTTTSAVLFQPSKNPTSYLPNNTAAKPNQNTKATIKEPNSTRSTPVPITPNVETPSIDQSSSSQTVHQRVNQQLQRQIKQRQLQLLQPRSPNVTQKITLVCRFCHKRPKFTNNVDYSNHIINTHPAEKPYNCPHCPKHFSRRFERQQHVAQVHGSRYQCAQCGLSFCAQRALDFHLQKYHANLGRSHQQQQQQQQQQQHLQQNSTSSTTTTTSAAAPPPPATYQLLQHNQQQRLVRVEDVHVQVTEENKNKRSIDLNLERDADIQTSQSLNEVDLLSATSSGPQKQQSRKLGCPDCNGDNDDCCGSNKNHDHQHNMQQQEINLQQQHHQQQQYAGNESVNNHQQHPQHITIPSPEQTEPDSTTTLRHFRKRQLSELTTPHFATSPSSSSSSSSSSSTSSSSSLNNNNHNAATTNNNGNLNHNSPDYVLAGNIAAGAGVVATVRGGGGGGGGVEQIMVERSLRATHNCLLCEDTFTNEIALRKHHHLAHGAATQTITNTPTIISALVCTICKRTFRMRNALHRHMETHDVDGRPYECNICQVRFPRPSQLTLHKLTVHKFEKPNSCEECGKQFGTESAMKAHAKEHEEAASLITASSASDTTAATLLSSSVAASSSTTSSSPPPPPPHQQQLPSRIYYEAMTTTTKTTSISTSTLSSSSSSSSTIITNEQNINLQSTTSGEECTTATNIQNNNNNNNNNVAIYNIATQNTIVSGLSL